MSQPSIGSDILTLDEVATYLRLPEDMVEQEAKSGLIPGRKIGDTWRFLRNAVDAWLWGAGINHPNISAPADEHEKQDAISSRLEEELSQLHFLRDDELWRAAESQLPLEASTRMQTLISKLQASYLTKDEQDEADALAYRAQRNMLVRAQSAVILQDRGHDISRLKPQKVKQKSKLTH
ncbi:MAG: helix-turn-helix domain-containing protein [Chloroflexota bacterium]